MSDEDDHFGPFTNDVLGLILQRVAAGTRSSLNTFDSECFPERVEGPPASLDIERFMRMSPSAYLSAIEALSGEVWMRKAPAGVADNILWLLISRREAIERVFLGVSGHLRRFGLDLDADPELVACLTPPLLSATWRLTLDCTGGLFPTDGLKWLSDKLAAYRAARPAWRGPTVERVEVVGLEFCVNQDLAIAAVFSFASQLGPALKAVSIRRAVPHASITVDDEDLRQLSKITSLTSLRLEGVKCPGLGLASLTSLRSLELPDYWITQTSCLETLTGLTKLELTHTSHFPVRSPLRNLPPPSLPITKLRLGGPDFNMGSFSGNMGSQLRALTGLEDLELYRMPIIPDSLSILFMLTRMTSLGLIECRRLSHYSLTAAVGHDMLTLETVSLMKHLRSLRIGSISNPFPRIPTLRTTPSEPKGQGVPYPQVFRTAALSHLTALKDLSRLDIRGCIGYRRGILPYLIRELPALNIRLEGETLSAASELPVIEGFDPTQNEPLDPFSDDDDESLYSFSSLDDDSDADSMEDGQDATLGQGGQWVEGAGGMPHALQLAQLAQAAHTAGNASAAIGYMGQSAIVALQAATSFVRHLIDSAQAQGAGGQGQAAAGPGLLVPSGAAAAEEEAPGTGAAPSGAGPSTGPTAVVPMAAVAKGGRAGEAEGAVGSLGALALEHAEHGEQEEGSDGSESKVEME